MTDNTSTEGRGLLTETERAAIAGDRSDSYRYKTRSYLKRRIDKLETDVEVLDKHAPELLAEIHQAVNIADKRSQQDPTPDETDPPERQHTAQLATTQTPETTTTTTETLNPTHRDIRDALRQHFDTDAGPRRRPPREALIDLVILLREKGPLTTADARKELYPQHEDEYSSPSSLWDSVRRYFDETPGIKKPNRGEYDFTSTAEILKTMADK